MTAATEGRAHCDKCRVEVPLSLERVRIEGLAAMRCPRCGARMQWGPLPPEEPDRRKMAKLEQALQDVTERLAKVDPAPVLAAREAEIAELQRRIDLAAVTGVDLTDLEGDPVKEVGRHLEEVRKARQEREELEEAKAVLERELGPLREAARFHARARLEKRLQEPLPGDAECKRMAAELGKFAERRAQEIAERQAEARRLGLEVPHYRDLSSQLAFYLDGPPILQA